MTEDVFTRPNTLPWPPLIFAAAWILGFALQNVAPIGDALPRWVLLCGRVVAAAGIALDLWAMAVMTAAHTNIMPNHGARRLVTSGPFALTRNPIYLGNTLVTLGIGLGLDALWFIPLAVAAAVLVERLAIRREEAHLAARFGAEWTAYAAATPRWLGVRGRAG
ncbi:isoprenylcysteine carboxyl methyltransferase [Rhodoblastus sphagnicola]|uniref:Isoprenylcysteine carboxyl methyltransferase n=1 Tax=Rhodoblastus sphagnicola TaxID=333368 RepID=A0A2S6N6G0_9HYPH|nr:isoprenylcysteine carboxylmethyltransferase family protein [Rhodoblastus sphagnicola]MBB4197694.1 protein-S-isoprenylcysteine O-methyltransferase Ste14 [Rhodoblastus sphagnicola]PPQ30206.1 isoprenylcysteine carboxyl methyltransferase [Rhodoblastus sphagnicola]